MLTGLIKLAPAIHQLSLHINRKAVLNIQNMVIMLPRWDFCIVNTWQSCLIIATRLHQVYLLHLFRLCKCLFLVRCSNATFPLVLPHPVVLYKYSPLFMLTFFPYWWKSQQWRGCSYYSLSTLGVFISNCKIVPWKSPQNQWMKCFLWTASQHCFSFNLPSYVNLQCFCFYSFYSFTIFESVGSFIVFGTHPFWFFFEKNKI